MYHGLKVVAIIPAMNEQQAVAKVVTALLSLGGTAESPWIDEVIVCDNASTDDTAKVAREAGAKVVEQQQAGYGIACLTAIAALPECDVVLFVDGDDSCFVEQAVALLDGIHQGADLSIGSRVLGRQEQGALTFPQRIGNHIAVFLIRFFWRIEITDLGPFRAIRKTALDKIAMQDTGFGWTVEMQIKAVQHSLDIREYPVDSKKRIGSSKISGTVKGVVGAAYGIIGTILKMRWQQERRR